jgi:hypothetical protein
MEVPNGLPKGLLKRVQHGDRGGGDARASGINSGTTRCEPQMSSVPGEDGS